MRPFLTISIDFELFWGVYDVTNKGKYGDNILGARKAIPKLLELFNEYDVHATWAAVGLLTFSNKNELMAYLPETLPDYKNSQLDVYKYLSTIGSNEKHDPYHYGYSLIRQIEDSENMEIASHTFSHFYCLEEQSNTGAFLADLHASNCAFSRLGIKTKSLVFPRNQYNSGSLEDAYKAGFRVFRGNEDSCIYKVSSKSNVNLCRRSVRLADAYINISGANNSLVSENHSGILNLPSSRFLRPAGFQSLERLRLKRIFSDMDNAARNGVGYHLWFHPHNFGINLERNLSVLTKILVHYKYLQFQFDMQSRSMSEAIF